MRRNYDFLDITKFVLSFFVVAIHTNPFGDAAEGLRFPFVRIAVPVFFLISSFLLFEKVHTITTEQEKWQTILKFVKRNLQLYLAWFVVLLPITIYVRGYFQTGFADTLKKIAFAFLFGSTFQASWFIMALVIGVLIVWIISKWFRNGGALAVGFVSYYICCMVSNYRNVLPENSWLVQLQNVYPSAIYNSFPVSIIWICLGKWIAEHKEFVQKLPMGWVATGTSILFVALLAEHYWIQEMQWSIANDCYYMLVPVCTAIFVLALNAKVQFQAAKKLRYFSTVTYCIHMGLTTIIGMVLKDVVGMNLTAFGGALLLYVIVIFGCAVATMMICWLKKFRFFSFLRFLV